MRHLFILNIVILTIIMQLSIVARGADVLPAGVEQNLDLAPTAGNPRNSEGDFINLKDGRIVFIYTHFTAHAGDDSPAELCSRTSADGGKTWTEQDQVVFTPADHPHATNLMSVSLLRLKDDRILLFYCVKQKGLLCQTVVRVSTDEAKTWGQPTLCMSEPGYFVVNNARVIQLKSGRILLPTARHDDPAQPNRFQPGVVSCFFSDDGGTIWRQSKTQLKPPAKDHAGLQEPAVIELTDGRVRMLMRTDMGSQFSSTSDDGGDTWSPAEKTDILSSLSPCSIKRIPSTGDLFLVWTDGRSDADAAHHGKRTPLVVAISRDDGKTWEHRKVLYDDPAGWYCYTAIDFVGDRVLLAHCAGEQSKKSSGLARTVITSFDVAWLYH